MIKYEQDLSARVNGNNLQPLAGAEVRVTDKATGLPAALYQDDELTPIPQPLVTTNTGYFGFKAANGEYLLRFAPGPNSSRFDGFTRDCELYDADDVPNPVSVVLSSLGAEDGAGKVGYRSRKVADKLGEMVSVFDYMTPEQVNNCWLRIGTIDVRAAIQEALDENYHVHLPAAAYLSNGSITIPTGRTLRGDGVKTLLSFNVAGDGLVSAYPINGSHAADITIEDMEVRCTNPANAGGGYADTCGSYISLHRVVFRSWKYGTILDQTEHCHIREGQYHGNVTAGVWLVNGNTRTSGAATNFTNRISITGTQFNANGIGIIDDGGVSHVFDDNNFNGGVLGLRIAGARNISVCDNEIEYATQCGILLATTRADGTGIGRSFEVVVDKNFMIATQNTPCISAVSVSNLAVRHNHMESHGGVLSTTHSIVGCANVLGLSLGGNDVLNFLAECDAVAPTTAQLGGINGNMLTELQGYGATSGVTGLNAYCPSAAGGGAPLGGVGLQANNSAGVRTTYAWMQPAIYDNTAGAETGAMQIYAMQAGVKTVVAEMHAGGIKSLAGFGCNGKNPQAAVSLGAPANDLPSAIARIEAIAAALIANGICA